MSQAVHHTGRAERSKLTPLHRSSERGFILFWGRWNRLERVYPHLMADGAIEAALGSQCDHFQCIYRGNAVAYAEECGADRYSLAS